MPVNQPECSSSPNRAPPTVVATAQRFSLCVYSSSGGLCVFSPCVLSFVFVPQGEKRFAFFVVHGEVQMMWLGSKTVRT